MKLFELIMAQRVFLDEESELSSLGPSSATHPLLILVILGLFSKLPFYPEVLLFPCKVVLKDPLKGGHAHKLSCLLQEQCLFRGNELN